MRSTASVEDIEGTEVSKIAIIANTGCKMLYKAPKCIEINMKPQQHTVTSVSSKSSIVWVRTNSPFSKIFRGNLEEICQDLEIFAHASLPYDAL